MTHRTLAACTAAVMMAGCGWQGDCGPGGVEGARMRVATTNAEFARIAVERGPAPAFASVLADDAVFLAPNHPALYGPDDIVTYLEGAPALRMTWTTADAEVARSCDIGYTFGAWTAGGEDADGNPVSAQGKYLATWRHVRDVGWRLAVYIQNFDAPVEAVEAEPDDEA